MERYLCIHCHFYQPPRENPWLEAVEQQDSAYPYHDWNERITAECYEPNSVSRILGEDKRIERIVNNYSRISFNFGPTLLSWMEEKAPQVYAAILEADRESQKRFGGHGSALAQAYNHMILPLSNRRDKYTQALWGLRDFEHRFGRKPEGMWLPETAVDLESLDVLAELGIKFTILAPHQAAGVRPLGEGGSFHDVGHANIDPTRAYLCRLPSGREISLFFYDGPISRAVAFEGLLSNGEHFAQRLTHGYDEARHWAQLMHIATDGETYGHHHRHGDMALAFALHHIESHKLAQVTNYGEFLERFPPQMEVQVRENTSWSCSHGIERWRSDCGCNSGMHAGWHQGWRGPLRAALDGLRDELQQPCEAETSKLLRHPWQARDEYIRVVLDRSAENVDRFLSEQAGRQLGPEEQVRALQLLEMQRHLMLMYTSCGWFFDELSGIETVQVMAYAGRAIQLAQELFGDRLEQRFLERLAQAPSNLAEHQNGARIYEQFVRPAMVTLLSVGAHYAISSLFETGNGGKASIYGYDVEREDYRLSQAGRARLALGHALIRSRITRESCHASFAVLHLGDHNVNAGVRLFRGPEAYEQMAQEAEAAFLAADMAGTIRLLDRHFEGISYSLRSIFRDEQRRVLRQILAGIMEETEASYRQIYEHHAPVLRFLAELGTPAPRVLQTTAEFVLNSNLRRALTDEDLNLEQVTTLLETAAREKVKLDEAGLSFAMERRLERLTAELEASSFDLPLLERFAGVIRLVEELPFEVNTWRAQNAFYRALQSHYPQMKACQQAREDCREWVRHFEALGELLHMRVEAPATAS
jgi:alpha-amylase/alpha-mannosidase (GH57 family)